MHRRFAIAFAGLALAGLARPSEAPGQSPAELIRTAAFQAAFQNADGGFADKPGGPSTLGATSSAIRTLGYVGGSIRDVPGAIAFVARCFDPAAGGFAPTPGGAVDVGTTASGLMAVSSLKLDPAPYAEKATSYLGREAKTFEEIRIAVAGLEAIGAKAPEFFPRWAEQITKDRNPDGTFGQGSGQPRATGSAVVALLRMGIRPEDSPKAAILAALRAGQKPEGGWASGDGPVDLNTSYRIMRCFFMLKERPDLARLRAWIAAHRQADGGYASTPGSGSASNPGATYLCSVMGHWARLLDGEPALVEAAGFAPLFNGKDLAGWEGDTSLWSARDGVLVGDSPGIKANQFLATEASYGDFILKYTVRLVGDEGNSGVQFRSVRVPGTEMAGYQADIGPGWWGSLYDESRRNQTLVPCAAKALEALHKGDWNHVTVRAMGNHITVTLNGITAVDYREADPKIARDGRIALQIHAGGPMKVEFKDVLIQRLPEPRLDAEANAPGFHLRTVAAPGGDRKYTVYVPPGYDGSKAMPAILFLHGSGERGDDGIQGGQIGLGAAILAHPERFPAIVVLPQAKETWRADSDDARGALAALEQVMAAYKVDPDRVALTGLSMGGSGTWSIASAQPGRFSCIAPICGRGRPEMAAILKAVPTWTLVGDLDGEATVRNLREMAAALRGLGGSVHQTEYRAVGHNSWDRAYDDPALIAWMLGATRQGR